MKKLYFASVWGICILTLCTLSGANVSTSDPEKVNSRNVVLCTDAQLPQDKDVFAEYPEGHAPHSTNIIVNQYEDGVMYVLRKDADNSIVAGPQPGYIGLFVQGVTETTVYNVLARNQAGCERQMSAKPVITIIPDTPGCTPPADKQLVVDGGTGYAPYSTYIHVQDPQPGILYSLRINTDNRVIDGPRPGTEALFTGTVNQTTEYNVLAQDPGTTCETVLSTRPVVTILANPQARLLYPDLVSWAKAGTYMYDVVIDNNSGGRLLRFSAAMANKGAGAFELRAIVESDGTTTATQWIYDDQGGHQERYAGTFVFSDHAGHNHFHFADFAIYRLRAVLSNNRIGSLVATSDKVGFAMFDVSSYNLSLPGAPGSPVYLRQELSSLNPEGISVGWADVYGRWLGDQWINIAGVRDGQYWLEVIVDPNGLIAESDETNNTTYVKVILNGNRVRTNNDQPTGGAPLAARSASLEAAETEPGQTIAIASYPNPNRGEFDVVIEDDYTGLYYLLVRDFSGKTLEKQTIMKEERMAKTHVDLNQAGEGVYVLSVYGNGQTMNRKIVITN
jgi:hypothetical protein